MTKKTFPKLFRKTATGADDQWEISVAGRTITTRWGQIGGSLQTTSEVIAAGKCLGRVNATTPEEQAVLEAKWRWGRPPLHRDGGQEGQVHPLEPYPEADQQHAAYRGGHRVAGRP